MRAGALIREPVQRLAVRGKRAWTAREWHRQPCGGKQQRLILARALLRRPTLLFLDEASALMRRPRLANAPI